MTTQKLDNLTPVPTSHKPASWNYGKFAFANEKGYRATDKEKAEAVKVVMQSLQETYNPNKKAIPD